MAMLEFALRYAAIGWFIFPLHSIRFDKKCGCGREDCATGPGKHPRTKWGHGQTPAETAKPWLWRASTDPATITAWWTKWPNAGIGCATGPSRLLVADADGPKGVEAFRELLAGVPCPPTARARTARGVHVFFRSTEGRTRSNPETKLDTRGQGGFVVLAPSPHVSGHVYRWEVEPWGEIAEAPAELVAYSQSFDKRSGERKRGDQGRSWGVPGNEVAALSVASVVVTSDFTTRLGACLVDWHEVDRALERISPDCSMDEWIKVGMALHAAGDDVWRWQRWSERGQKHREGEPAYRWSTFKPQGVDGVGLGSLFVIAKGYGYERSIISTIQEEKNKKEGMNGHAFNGSAANGEAFFSQFNDSPDNPLIRLNKDYSVIGNVGGKCLVLSWENSQVDQLVKVPTFQSFKSFSERYGNEYIPIKKVKHLKTGDEEYEDQVQLGAYWLRWPERRTYEGIELAPNQAEVLPNGNYNLWRGFGVEPKRGDWSLMREHVRTVLAKGDREAEEYILKFAAWSVQHPGERAEAALVLRGGKGTGKGVFLGALRRIFGGHGMQIFNRSHMVGNFNAHMRNCLFLFADEAYWAGDKQGESVLKGLISEPVLVLEQKGIDPVAWPNRMKVAMAANAAWVVPASHGERRYAVFDVADDRAQDPRYFTPLLAEVAGEGLGAMLFDMLQMDLGAWHPRYVPQTDALQSQKAHSLPPFMEWWEGVLQGGANAWEGGEWPAGMLFEGVRNESPGTKNLSDQRIASFLKGVGATKRHSETGSKWKLPALPDARTDFERKYGKWKWDD